MRTTVLLACLLLCPAVARAQVRQSGDVTTVAVGTSRVDLTLAGGAIARVEVLDDDIVRVRFAPTGVLTTRVTGAVVGGSPGTAAVYDTPEAVYLVSTGVSVIVAKQPYRVVVFRADGSLVQADLEPAVTWDPFTGVLFTRKWAPPDEHYYGLGERAGPLDRRGRQLLMHNVDWAGHPALAATLYIAIPYYWALRDGQAHGLYLDNGATSFFHLDPESNGELTFGAVAGELDYYVMPGPTPQDVTRDYGAITGFSALPPQWTLGFHQSRYGYASQTEFLTIASTLRSLQLPSDVLYFDIDYLSNLGLFSWNAANFPDPWGMNMLLGAMGFKRVNIMEPVVRQDDWLFPYLSGSGFLLQNGAGETLVNDIWYGRVGWLDFTRSAAADWYRSTLALFLSWGIDAVWNDLNEPAQTWMPEAVYDFDGERRTDTEARNLYALREAAISYEAQLEARPTVRPWGISRSGFAGIQRYMANWGGDADSTWDSLRASVQMSLSMSLSGQNFFGHDIGGFLGAPSAELFTRWMEFAAYTPLFRNHAMNTSPPREPWAFGEPTLTRAREILNERYRLLPYLYTLVEQASRTGEPSLAPLFYYFPADSRTWTDDSAFMVGASMLVAPVLVEGATSRSVYLPGEGTWFDAATGIPYAAGASHVVEAPLGRIPVFVRGGAIIPKGPVVQHTGERPLTEVRLHLYPGPESSFTLYEDDGSSFAYQGGAYLRTRITRRDDGPKTTCVIEPVAGALPPPSGRAWYLEFHDVPAFAIPVANGVPVPFVTTELALAGATSGWTRAADGHVIVKVPDQTGLITVELHRVSSLM